MESTPRPTGLGVARRRRGEDAIRALLFLATAISVLTTIGILVALLNETIKFFGDVGIGRLVTDAKWSPLFADPQYGIRQLLIGTFLVTGIAIVVAIPLGIGSAIYLSEYASPRGRRIIKPILETLVGVPTIVFGYFALTWLAPTFLHDFLGIHVGVFSALAAGLVMGIMVLPTITSISDDAMTAVPQGLREGAYGLGASKRQVATRVVVPAALSGIVASVVLGVSRAVGETMIALIVAGQQPSSSLNPVKPTETITTFIGATAKGDIPQGTTKYETIFVCGAVLFFLTLFMNAIAIRFVRKYREIYE
jgi:phosphate transport system permease protein